MATHPGMLLAYDADGNVLRTQDCLVKHDPNTGALLGLENYAENEEMGRPHMPDPADPEPWRIGHGAWTISDPNVKGSKVWLEWLGSAAHNFRVELAGKAGKKHIAALVHKTSGHRRERAVIEAAIEAVPVEDGAKDLRRLVGGPQRPLTLDEDGRTAERLPMGTPAHLPLIAPQKGGGQ